MSEPMLRDKKNWKIILAAALLAAAVVLAGLSLLFGAREDDGGAAARRMGRSVGARLELLEKYALQSHPDRLPEDMVIYRYENDSLVAWFNQFPLFNDDITTRVEVQRLTNSCGRLVSPLTDLTEDYAFVNYGPKWYVARCQEIGSLKIVSGLEVANDLVEREYVVKPLSGSDGFPVEVDGVPLFNVSRQRKADSASPVSPLIIALPISRSVSVSSIVSIASATVIVITSS